MKTVREVQDQEEKDVMRMVETIVMYGETKVVAYVGIDNKGRIIILPQVHAEYINPITVECGNILFDEYQRDKKLHELYEAEKLLKGSDL